MAMTNEEKYNHWLAVATYDLETAQHMLHSGRYAYVAFASQQAIEKLVKALHVLYTGNEAPKTHNIKYIFDLIFGNPNNVEKITEETFSQEAEKYSDLFGRLHLYYISERYSIYKRKISEALNHEIASKLLQETEEAFTWLQSLKEYWK